MPHAVQTRAMVMLPFVIRAQIDEWRKGFCAALATPDCVAEIGLGGEWVMVVVVNRRLVGLWG